VAKANVTGVLLVGGASMRFGSPKALARFEGETLAARAWRLLGDECAERIAVGKRADGLPLGFDIVDDGTPVRAALAGLVAGLRAAPTELCVVIPVDCPLLTPAAIARLAGACLDAAVPQTGPLPGAYRRSALPVVERRLAAGAYELRGTLAELETAYVTLPEEVLVNVNRFSDLLATAARA
jgi:molybdenum cofactor guanylyltransferase